MTDCDHEWRAGLVWFGCMPGVKSQDFECARCGEHERRPFDADAYQAGMRDFIERVQMELQYLRDDES